jgi:hypothetical protein
MFQVADNESSSNLDVSWSSSNSDERLHIDLINLGYGNYLFNIKADPIETYESIQTVITIVVSDGISSSSKSFNFCYTG